MATSPAGGGGGAAPLFGDLSGGGGATGSSAGGVAGGVAESKGTRARRGGARGRPARRAAEACKPRRGSGMGLTKAIVGRGGGRRRRAAEGGRRREGGRQRGQGVLVEGELTSVAGGCFAAVDDRLGRGEAEICK